MDQQERELLCETMAIAIDWSFKQQTKHLVEAMPCLCSVAYVEDGRVLFASHVEHCDRCNKLEELNK